MSIKKKAKVNFFVSYAHRNEEIVFSFLEKMNDQFSASAFYNYEMWDDRAIELGEDWDDEIQTAIQNCDFGLLLVSPAFLGSRYIEESELPSFISGNKACIPVMMQPIDFARHDLKGLEKKQIFRLDYDGFKEPRPYGDCKPKRRDTFALELFKKIEEKLDKNFKPGPGK